MEVFHTSFHYGAGFVNVENNLLKGKNEYIKNRPLIYTL